MFAGLPARITAAASRLPRPQLRRPAASLLVAAMVAAPLSLLPAIGARAYQVPATTWGGTGTTAIGSLPSGLTMTATVTAPTAVNNRAFVPGTSYAATAAMFTPAIAPAGQAVQFLTDASTCGPSGLCPNRGTVTLDFSHPVRNPVLHMAGFGGSNTQNSGGVPIAASAIHTIGTLTSSVPAGATFGAVPAGATNLTSTASTFQTTNANNSPNCGSTSVGGITYAATAGCGSVPVNGTVSRLVLSLDIFAQVTIGPGAGGTAGSGDGWSLTFTADEDYGDAPSSYEAGAPAAHVVGDLRLGAAVDRENVATVNPGTGSGGLAVGAGANANSPAGDGTDDDGVATPLPALTTDKIGGTYSLPVTLSGAGAAGTVCGWIDLNRDGAWSATGERACATFAAGATSANLTWTVANATSGRTYARIRTGYTVTQVQSPTGLADSGEVEDYTLEIKPSVRVIKKFVPATAPGTVDLKINGTTLATGVANNGSTGYRSVYGPTALDAPDVSVTQDVQTQAVPITVTEAGAGGTILADYATATACVDANGAVVPNTAGALSIPQSSSASGGNGKAQTITCTITNTAKLALANDVASTPQDTTISVPVLANDLPSASGTLDPTSVRLLDPVDDTFRTSVTIPGEGTYTVNAATGAVVFDPLPTFLGTTTPLTYQASDGGAPDIATLTITVTAKKPVAAPDAATTPQGLPVVVDVPANDAAGSFPLAPGTVLLKDPTDGAFKASVTVPGEGKYTVDPATGKVTFDPEPAFSGVATPVTYQIKDTSGAAATSTIAITVTKVVPKAVDDAVTTPSDTTVSVPVAGNDAPGDPAVPLDPSSVLLKDPADGAYKSSVTVPGEGKYTVDPATGVVTFDPEPTFAGTATPLTYRVADANGTTATATLTVKVTGAPVAKPDAATTPQNVNVTLDPLVNDAPGASGGAALDPATVRLKDPADGTYKTTVTVPGEGKYAVDPATGKVTFDPEPAFSGVATPVTYEVKDQDGVRATSTITITVTKVVPTATNDAATTLADTNVTVAVLGNDAPGAPFAPLDPTTVQLKDPADGTYKASVTVPGEGVYAVDPVTGKVTFDPEPTFAGATKPLPYRVADANGSIATAALTITVKKAPDAKPDTGTTPQNVNVTVDPLVNDVPGGSPLDPATVRLKDPADGTYKTMVTVPDEGKYTVDPVTGRVTFDPEPAFSGVATPLTYEVKDQDGVRATSTITITVTKVVPKATDDVASTPLGSPATINVLGNDAPGAPSAPLDPSSVLLKDPADGAYKPSVTVPGEGKYTVDPVTGRVTFAPEPTFLGVAKPLTYRVADANGSTVTATITVTVVADPPTAGPDSATTPQGVAVGVGVLGNDAAGSFPLDPSTVLLKDPADGIYKTSVTVPGEGKYTVDPATGKVTFDPEPTFSGAAKPITYQVKDKNGSAATSTISITVTKVVPKAVDDAVTTPSDTTVSVPVAGNDAPGDPGVPLDPSSVLLKDPADGAYKTSVTVPGVGKYTVSSTTGVVTFDPEPTFAGVTKPLTYQVADANGTTATATLTVTVTGAPDAKPDAATTPQNVNVTVDPLVNDAPGASGGAALDPASVELNDPNSGVFKTSVTVPGEGVYTVDPVTGKVTFDPEPTFSGTATPITYRVGDKDGVTATSTITVKVTAITPTATDDTASTPSDTDVTVAVLGNDAPGAPGVALDPKTVQLKDPADGAYKTSVMIPGEGKYTVDPVTGKVTFDPEPTFAGATKPLPYRVADANGSIATAALTITVKKAPDAKPDTGTTPQNVTVTLDALANDTAGGAPLDPATVLLKDPADGGYKPSLTIPGEGKYTVDPATGKVTFDPEPTFSGTATPITYEVKDKDGVRATSTITVKVTAITPTAADDAAKTLSDTNVTVAVLGNDAPGAPGVALDPKTVQLKDPADGTYKTSVTVPGEGKYTVDPVTGKVTFDPEPTFAGVTKPLTYRVADANGTTATATLTVTVAGSPNAKPDVATTPQNVSVTVDPLANDAPGASGGAALDPSSVLLKDPADGVYKPSVTIPGEGKYTVDPATGKVTFDPEPAFSGTATPITYEVKDKDGVRAISTITVKVTAITPTAADDATSTPSDTNVTVDVLGNDAPGAPGVALDPKTVQLKDPADGAYKTSVTVPGEGKYTVDPVTGKVTFDPEPTFSGAATPIAYRVADANGTAATATLTVTVATKDPAASPDTPTTPQNVNVTVDVLGNDAPGSSPLDPTTVLLKDPADGTYKPSVTIPGEGVYTVDPVTGKVTFDPEPTFSGTATPITYEVKDKDGVRATSTITVKVTPIVPKAIDDAVSTPADTTVSVPVAGNDTPGAPGVPVDPSSVLLKDPADGAYKASVTVTGEGKYTVDPATGVVTFDPESTFAGVTKPLTYRVADANGTTATATLTVTVTGAPDAKPDAATTPQNSPVTIDVLGNDVPGASGGAPLDPTTVLLKDPADGTYKPSLTIPGEGKYTVDPATGKVTFAPEPAFSGPGTPIAYEVKDKGGVRATSAVTVTVTAIVPTAADDTAKTPSDTTVVVDVLGNDAPGDPGVALDPKTVQLKDPADGTYKTSVTIPGEGKYTVDPATGKVTFDPEPTFAGAAKPVIYGVADANGTTATATVTVTVGAAPVAKPDAPTTPQNVNVTIDVLGNDAPGSSPLDPTTVLLKDPADGTYKTMVTVPDEGKYTVDPVTGRVTFDPEPAFSGVATPLTYEVKDKDGVRAISTITVKVTAITPTATDDILSTPADTTVTTDVLGNDTPGDPGVALDPKTVLLKDPADGTYKPTVTIPGEGMYTVDPATGKVTFDPEPTFAGAAKPLTYRVADANGTTATAMLTVIVGKQAPVASPDAPTTPQNVNVTIDVLANDTAGGAPLDPTTVLLKDPADGVYKPTVTIPGEGKYTVDPVTGKVTFDPEPTFSGTATPITYQVKDKDGVPAISTITVKVTEVVPVAVDDAVTTPSDTTVSVPVAGNDTPGDPGVPVDPSSVLLKDPADGAYKASVTVAGVGKYTVDPATGVVTFDPEPTFAGAAKPLTYRVADVNGTTATATVTVTVGAAPVAKPDAPSTPQNSPVVIDVLGNDVPGATPLDPTTVLLKDPADGVYKPSVTIPGEGKYTVDPVTGKVTFDPEPTFSGTATPITYQVKDKDGVPATSTITVKVTAITPKAIDDAAKTPSDTTVVVDVLGNDTPGDPGVALDPKTVQLKDPADGVYKTSVTIPGEGKYTVDPATGVVTFDPEPTFAGAAKPLTYRVADANGTTATATVSVTVGAAPVAKPDAPSTPQNSPVVIDVLGNDVPGATPLDPTTVLLKDPADGTYKPSLTIPGEGKYTVDPVTGKVTFDPEPTFSGTATPITYQVKDKDGVPATSTITVKVTAITPKAIDDVLSTPADTTVVVDVLGNDTPGDPGVALDPKTVLLKDPADGVYKPSVTVPGEGKYTVDPATGKITFDPEPTFAGQATPVTYRVADANGTTDTATLTVSVKQAPQANPDAVSTRQNANVTIDPLVNDTAGGAALDPKTVLLKDPTDGAYKPSVTVPGEGKYTVDPATGKVTFDPEPTFTGAGTPITYQVKDGDGIAVTSTITVAVTDVLPSGSPDAVTTLQDVNRTLAPLANDVAGDPSAPLDPTSVLLKDPADGAYKPTVLVRGEGTYTVDPVTGKVTFDPEPTFTGPATPITYQVKDGNGTIATSTITVTVEAVTPAPANDAASTPSDRNVTVDVLKNDVAGDPSAPLDPMSVLLKDPADGAFKPTVTIPGEGVYTVDPATGKVTFDPEPTLSGPATPIAYQVSDDNGSTATATLSITVKAPPSLKPDTGTTRQDITVTLTPLANDTAGGAALVPGTVLLKDPTDGAFKATVTVPGEGKYTVDPATGKVAFDPEPTFTGPATPITYRVADRDGVTATATIAVTVTPITPVPVDDVAGTPNGKPAVVDVLDNDAPGDPSAPLDPTSVLLKDPADGVFKAAVTVPGIGGYVVDPVTGKVTFTPDPAFAGVAPPLTYRVTDGNGATATATLTLRSSPPPVANPDTANTEQNVPVTIAPLANDVVGSAALDPTTVLLKDPVDGAYKTTVTVAGEGTSVVAPETGRVRFSPLRAFSGTTKPLGYQVADGDGLRATSTITVGVSTTLPTARPDTDSTTQGRPVTTAVLGNDTASSGAPLVPATVRLKDPATGKLVKVLAVRYQGSYRARPDGRITFSPTPTFSGLAKPVTYGVQDDLARAVTSTLTVRVKASRLANNDSATTTAGQSVVIDVLANDTIVPGVPLDPSTLSLIDPRTGKPVTKVVVPGEGTWTVDRVKGLIVFTPADGFTGKATPIKYLIRDVEGRSAVATVSVTVRGQAAGSIPFGPLAFTGATGLGAGLAGAVLLLTGGLLLIGARRRRRRPDALG
jgi:CshA-type fibril repeat protein